MGVALYMEADCRHDAGARAGLAHGAHLLGPLPGPPVIAPQQGVLRCTPNGQTIDEGTCFFRQGDVAHLAALGDAHDQRADVGIVVGDLKRASSL